MSVITFTVSGDDISGDHHAIAGQDSIQITGSLSDGAVINASKGSHKNVTEKLIDHHHIKVNHSHPIPLNTPKGTYTIYVKHHGGVEPAGTTGTLRVGSGTDDEGDVAAKP
jgi:hypothetical protein